MEEQIKLEPGMLLLCPSDSPDAVAGKAMVYTVRSAKVLIYRSRGVFAESTLHESTLPNGWSVINPGALAEHLEASGELGDLVELRD